MAGIMFIATIPTKEFEKEINEKNDLSLNLSEKQENKEKVSFLPSVKSSSSICKASTEETLVNFLDSPTDEVEPERCNLIIQNETVKNDKSKNKNKLDFLPDTSMEEIMQQLLNNLKVDNYSWIPLKNNKFLYVIFCLDSGPAYDEALRVLTKWGIGVRLKSTLGVIPCKLYFKASEKEEDENESEGVDKNKDNKSPWNEFVLSVVRSRLAVAQVVEEVKGNAKLTFDFVSLIILAGTIAGVGLVENSTVSIVASMLISPLMGPILAGTFGTVIHDRKLQIIGVRNEFVGLLLTVLVGFIIGLIIGGVDDYYGTGEWPTPEMMSRGQLRSLWVGVLIALPSGAGVALGLLSDNSGSLIGVAISASLLPPAVNAGLFWALAVLDATMDRASNITEHSHPHAQPVYSEHVPTEMALLGCVSLSLTLVNILCIFLAGIIVLKIKEVAPRALTDDAEQFWHHDIKVARDYNRSLGSEDARKLELQLCEEMRMKENQPRSANSPNDELLRIKALYTLSPEARRRLTSNQRKNSMTTWSTGYGASNHRKSSLKDLEELYTSLGGGAPPRLSLSSHWRLAHGSSWIPWNQEDSIGEEPLMRRANNAPNRRFVVTPTVNDPLKQEK